MSLAKIRGLLCQEPSRSVWDLILREHVKLNAELLELSAGLIREHTKNWSISDKRLPAWVAMRYYPEIGSLLNGGKVLFSWEPNDHSAELQLPDRSIKAVYMPEVSLELSCNNYLNDPSTDMGTLHINQPFWVMKYPIGQEEVRKLLGESGEDFTRSMACSLCNYLNRLENLPPSYTAAPGEGYGLDVGHRWGWRLPTNKELIYMVTNHEGRHDNSGMSRGLNLIERQLYFSEESYFSRGHRQSSRFFYRDNLVFLAVRDAIRKAQSDVYHFPQISQF